MPKRIETGAPRPAKKSKTARPKSLPASKKDDTRSELEKWWAESVSPQQKAEWKKQGLTKLQAARREGRALVTLMPPISREAGKTTPAKRAGSGKARTHHSP
jgi:hypothetical protein